MPIPLKSFPIAIKSSTNINAGESCKVTNLSRTSVALTGDFRSENECVLNAENSDVEWVVGDKIMITISGRLVGSKEVTLTKGGIRTTVTTVADIISPAIDL